MHRMCIVIAALSLLLAAPLTAAPNLADAQATVAEPFEAAYLAVLSWFSFLQPEVPAEKHGALVIPNGVQDPDQAPDGAGATEALADPALGTGS